MKKNTLIIIVFVLSGLTMLFGGISYAAVSPTPTATDLQQQINNLQTKIASKVAELNLVEKRGIVGKVTSSSDTQITLTDLNGNTRLIDVDELTKFSSPSSNSFGISDIKEGTLLGVLGLYNKQSKRILARTVSVESEFPKIVYGIITFLDKTNYEITITKPTQGKEVVEITDITKTLSFSSGASLIKSGFSKMQKLQTVFAIGIPDKQDPNKIIGERIILFPDINLSSQINLSEDAPAIPPSTGSGVKLYPLGK